MARKTLEDFNYDYQAYADYLESPECANDEGYDIYVDLNGNIYERTDGDWTKGHGHNNVNDPKAPREPNDPSSIGRKWKNPWLKYSEKLNLTAEEIQFLEALYAYKQVKQNNEFEENNNLSKRR